MKNKNLAIQKKYFLKQAKEIFVFLKDNLTITSNHSETSNNLNQKNNLNVFCKKIQRQSINRAINSIKNEIILIESSKQKDLSCDKAALIL